MSEHRATIAWRRSSDGFDYEGYNREHRWTFDEGIEVPASAAPDFRGRPGHVDPEAALVASLSSCHMLTFLAIAARKRLVVDAYEDQATGVLEKNAEGRMAVTRVTLRPRITFAAGVEPEATILESMHHKAHAACFIANSVRTEIAVEPR